MQHVFCCFYQISFLTAANKIILQALDLTVNLFGSLRSAQVYTFKVRVLRWK